MDPVTATLIVALVEKCIQYGPSLVAEAIAALNKDTVTLEDIQAIKITKEPEEY